LITSATLQASFDDLFGHGVAGGRLATDQNAAIDPVSRVATLDPVIEVDGVQDGQELALVFVDALDLDVEQAADREGHAAVGPDQVGQPLFVLVPHGRPALPEVGVIGQRGELLQLIEVGDPALADALTDQLAEARIATGQPAALGDAVGLVVELLRPEFVEVAHQSFLQQFGMQGGDAVDREAADDGQMGHAHLRVGAFLDDAHAGDAVGVAGPPVGHLPGEAGVDLVDDFQEARQELAEERHRPLLQRLRQ